MKWSLLFFLGLVCFLEADLVVPVPLKQEKELSIAIVADSPYYESSAVRKQLIMEIEDLMEGEYRLEFSPEELFLGNNDEQLIEKKLLEAEENPEYDIVVTLGPIASYVATTLGPLPKPTFASFILGVKLQNTPIDGETSGVHNLNYLTFPDDVDKDIEVFQQVVPFKHLAYIGRKNILQAIPDCGERLEEYGRAHGVEVTFVTVEGIEDLISTDIPEGVDAVYVALLPGTEEELETVRPFADKLIFAGLPSFTLMSGPFIEEGLMMSISPQTNLKRIFRRIALNIQRATLGQDPKDYSVFMSMTEQLNINIDTADALGISIPFDLLVDANIVRDPRLKPMSPLTMRGAVIEGVANNTLLAASWRQVTAGAQVVLLAKSQLKPQVDIGGFARIIDRDRAIASNGFEPQTLVSGLASGSQMIYSNSLIGQYCIERNLQKARIQEFNNFYLNTVLEISIAYLNLLRTQTITEIQRNNLALTRSNLTLAEQRVEVGIARKSEVYRWESQISVNRTNLITSAFSVRSDMTRLNRLLNREQDKEVETVEVSPFTGDWLFQPNWFHTKYNTMKKLENMMDYAVGLGQQLSPEIGQFISLITARREELGVASRAFWTPDVFFNGEIQNRIYKGGAGKKFLFFPVDTTDWIVSLNVSFPLYDGGGKCSEWLRAKEELIRAEFDLENSLQDVEQRIRTNIYQASGSYASIGLTRDALEAARKNLELVKNQYSLGTTSIIDLLDAQNQALNAELEHTDALYGFLIDHVTVQREIGLYDFLLSPAEKECYENHMKTYLKEEK